MHIPVLLHEVVELLNPKKGEFFIDGTINGGGHAREILKIMGSEGVLLGIDWDSELIDKLKNEWKAEKNVILRCDNYRNIPDIIREKKLEKADCLLLDLGFSNYHIKDSGRGFSFLKDEPLDMRYHQCEKKNCGNNLTAKDVLNGSREEELADIFWKFGEERYSRKIAESIVTARRRKKILMTSDLVEIIENRMPHRGRTHPATRVFQALRMYVNKEMENLESILESIENIMNPHGRVAIISFHSIEDRIVKNYFKKIVKEEKAIFINKKPIEPSLSEIKSNPKSRSAKLRAIEIKTNNTN